MKHVFICLSLALSILPQRLLAQFGSLPEAERQRLASFPFDTMRVDTLNEWAFQTSGPQAQQHAQLALELAQKTGYRQGISDSYMQLGIAATDARDYAGAEQDYRLALKERQALHLWAKAAGCYNQLGHLQRRQGHYDAAIELFRQGLALMKNQPAHINTAKLYNSLGAASRLAGQFEQADSAFRAGIQVYGQLVPMAGDEKSRREYAAGLASLRMNTGAFLQDNRLKFKEAKDSLLKSLADFKTLGNSENMGICLLLLGSNAYFRGDLDEAQAYYEQGLAMKGVISDNYYYILCKSRGRVFLDRHKYEPAWADFQTSLNGFTALHDTPQIVATQFEIGNFFYEQSKMDSAITHYRQALAFNPEDVMLKGRLLYFLSDALDQSGQKEAAAAYASQYIQVLDKLNAGQTKGAFYDLIRHQIDKNQLFKTIAQRNEEATRLHAIIGLSGLSLLLLLAVLFAVLQRQKRRLAERNAEIARQTAALAKQKEEIARQNEQIAVQENLDLLKNKEMETHYARLEGQDAMQKEIGRELHDSVGAMLASVKLNLAPVDEVLDVLPAAHRRQYATANRLLGEATEEVRRISHELSSAVLQKFGLKAQLEALADIIPGSGKLQVELVTHGLKERLDYKIELHIYRMVQELVHNVVKHAQAQNVSIQVNRFGDRINMIVEDDGRGFDVENIRQKPGLGMQNLAARVHELSGTLQIDSRPGRGTLVSVDIPLTR